jgi:hypothetical protein
MSFALSNFPPGVTGREPQIAGPVIEDDRTLWCETCQEDRLGFAMGYDRWSYTWVCHTCDTAVEMEADDGPDPDEWYDRMREQEWGLW